MVPDVIRKCLSLPAGAPLPIFGDGTQTRTLTHIDDIADGIVTATSSPAGLNEDFNISASDERTVADIASVIWRACGTLHEPHGDLRQEAREWQGPTISALTEVLGLFDTTISPKPS